MHRLEDRLLDVVRVQARRRFRGRWVGLAPRLLGGRARPEVLALIGAAAVRVVLQWHWLQAPISLHSVDVSTPFKLIRVRKCPGE